MNTKNKKMIGHDFLRKLGKKRLRPGGKKGTEFLIKAIKKYFNDTTNIVVLEVSCNIGLTAIEIAKKFNCKVIGIDIDDNAIQKAKQNIKDNNLEHLIKVYKMDAANIELENMKFDVIINEAMLSMYKNKSIFLDSYFNLLKDNGILLTHDICYKNKIQDEVENELKDVINMKPYPLTIHTWKETLSESNFEPIDYLVGKLRLVSPISLVMDEGVFGTVKIFVNGMKSENVEMFKKMRSYFSENRNNLGFIAIISKKKKVELLLKNDQK